MVLQKVADDPPICSLGRRSSDVGDVGAICSTRCRNGFSISCAASSSVFGFVMRDHETLKSRSACVFTKAHRSNDSSLIHRNPRVRLRKPRSEFALGFIQGRNIRSPVQPAFIHKCSSLKRKHLSIVRRLSRTNYYLRNTYVSHLTFIPTV